MPNREGVLNRTISVGLSAAAEKLYVIIPNGDVRRQIAIDQINYGYTSDTVGALPVFGFGACQVLQNHSILNTGVIYSVLSPTADIQGEYIYFDTTNHYGSNVINFTNRPLIVEPGLAAVVIIPPALDDMGGLLTNQIAHLTVYGDVEQVPKERFMLGNYSLR